MNLTHMLKYNHAYFDGDTHFTVSTFEFYFKFPTPKPNKERLILVRDEYGRILSSKAPIMET